MEHLTLEDLLVLVQQHEDMSDRFTNEERAKLRSFLLTKIDNWKIYLDEQADAVARHRKYASEHSETARVLENGIERSKKYLAELMNEKGYERLPGQEWQISLRKSKSVYVEGDIACTPIVADMFPSLVSIKYSWDKTNIKKALEAGRCPLQFMSLKEKLSPVFDVKKK